MAARAPIKSRWILPATLVLIALPLAGCLRTRPVAESELPPSHRGATLSAYEPPEILDHLAEWYPGDWRVHLLRGLHDTAQATRLAALRRADSLRPDEPMVAYHLALALLGASHAGRDDGDSGTDSLENVRAARPYLDRALSLDPDNGVLKVVLAYALLREDSLPKARALFLDPRRVPRGDFYYGRLEEAVLGLFSHARQLNPYTLTEAAALYRGLPLPPFEPMIDILYGVFLSPLAEHPYDIRNRGRDAALGVFRLGRNLRVSSYRGPKVFSGGHEQRALGFMFQLKAAEFLTLYHRAFDDSAGAGRAYRDLVEVQAEY
ncbi:MAG TPA: hypothetical protein VK465_00145, partial [Fibrobacteria bacterium]|nr:hypothetical protein [Fibrobacteria bacterium]